MMPFVGVFFFGVLWRRTTTKAVLASVSAGFVVGPLLMIDSRRPFLPFMRTPLLRPWLHGAILEFLICAIVLAGVSLITTPLPKEKLATTTLAWAQPNQATETRSWPQAGDYRIWLGVVLAITTALWWWMR
jgi:Na+/proline symporter